MKLRDLGQMEYGACLALQLQELERIQAGGEPIILMVEHPLVATLGRRGSRAQIFDAKLPVFDIQRGGEATLHGPGQLVLYPIMHLGENNRDVRAWVRHLEQLLVDCLAHFGIDAHGKPDYPGVWTRKTDKKIASIGIAITQWTSYHGVALNVTISPQEFERIDPCGLGPEVMTNMRIQGAEVTMEEVQAWISAHAPQHLEQFRMNNTR